MPQINILNLLEGDNQSNLVDKINYNFDQILSAGGGPQGAVGPAGPTGPIGPQGPQGPQGVQGLQGSKWFVQDGPSGPSGSSGPLGPTSITGGNPASFPNVGDYWLDINSSNQDVYIYLGATAGWTFTGYGLAQGDVFQRISPVQFQGGGVGTAIMIAGTGASNDTVILSDHNIVDYATPSVTGLNYENSKFKITTDSRDKLISFGKSQFESSGGGSGGAQSLFNPYIGWDSISSSYNLLIDNPTGSVRISSSSSATGGQGVNIIAIGPTGEVSLTSTQSYIIASPAGGHGVYADVGSAGTGWLEVSNQPSGTPSPQSGAYLYVDSSGAGIGFGRTNLTTNRRKLSVNGNLAVGGDLSWHNTATSGSSNSGLIFSATSNSGVGGSVGSYSILSQGYLGVGSLGPGARNGVTPSVSSNSYNYANPRMWVVTQSNSASNPQAAADFRSEDSWTTNYPGRVQIGIGSPIFNDDKGLSSRIAQDIFFGTTGISPVELGMLSSDHRISNSGSQLSRVFSSTTYFQGTGPSRSVINTTGANKFLDIRATPSSTGGQVRIGVNGGTSSEGPIILAAGGSGAGVSGPNSVAIGENAQNFFSPNTTALGYRGGAQPNQKYHRLSVQGGVSIGEKDTLTSPETLIPNILPHDNSSPVGIFSMLKVHRDRDTTTSRANNYPNGIEISIGGNSNTGAATGAKNNSLALCVWDTDLNSRGFFALSPGFSVSDSGEKVNIGPGFPTRNNLSVVGNACFGDYSFVQTNGFTGPTNGIRVQGNSVMGSTGLGGTAGCPKLTIFDDAQSSGGLLISTGVNLNITNNATPKGSLGVEGQAWIGGPLAYIIGGFGAGARVVIAGGTGGNGPSVGATALYTATSMNGLPAGSVAANSTFVSTDTNISYQTAINKRTGSGNKHEWRAIQVNDDAGYTSGTLAPIPSGNTIFQVDGVGNTFSERSVRTREYHKKNDADQYVSYQNTGTSTGGLVNGKVQLGENEIYGVKKNEELICSGVVYLKAGWGELPYAGQYMTFPSGQSQMRVKVKNALGQYTTRVNGVPNSFGGSEISGPVGPGSKFDYLEGFIMWSRVGAMVNCSLILNRFYGRFNGGIGKEALIFFPVVLVQDFGSTEATNIIYPGRPSDSFSGIAGIGGGNGYYCIGSGTSFRGGPHFVEIKSAPDSFPYFSLSDSGPNGTDGAVRATFQYLLY